MTAFVVAISQEVLHFQYLEKPFLIALAIFQLYHGETKLIQWDDDEVHFVSDQYAQLD